MSNSAAQSVEEIPEDVVEDVAEGAAEAVAEGIVDDAQADDGAHAGPRFEAVELTEENLKYAVEAALLAAGRPLKVNDLLALFESQPGEPPTRAQLRTALDRLAEDWQPRGLELREVGNGFRLQVRPGYSRWMGGLWSERPPRYSRALLETLALMAYRQPITRGEIEDVRGVSISSSIIKTLLEREWVRVLGHREVPGRPALYGTTSKFLDDFGLSSLEGLPPLSEIKDIENLGADLFSDQPAVALAASAGDGEPEIEMAGVEDAQADDADVVTLPVEGVSDADAGEQAREVEDDESAHSNDPEGVGVADNRASDVEGSASQAHDAEDEMGRGR